MTTNCRNWMKMFSTIFIINFNSIETKWLNPKTFFFCYGKYSANFLHYFKQKAQWINVKRTHIVISIEIIQCILDHNPIKPFTARFFNDFFYLFDFVFTTMHTKHIQEKKWTFIRKDQRTILYCIVAIFSIPLIQYNQTRY